MTDTLPSEVIVSILQKAKEKDIVGDDILDRFIIHNCSRMDHNRLLQWFCKKHKIMSVVHLLKTKQESNFVYHSYIPMTAFKASVNAKKLGIAFVTCKFMPLFIKEQSKKLIHLLLIAIIKDKRAYHTERLVDLLLMFGNDNISQYDIPQHVIVRLFCHKHSAKICSVLNDCRLLDFFIKQVDNVFEEQERHDIVEQMIKYNNYISIDKLAKYPSFGLSVNHIIWASLLANEDTIIACLDGFKQNRCNKRLKKCIMTVCMAKKNKCLYERVKVWAQCTYAEE
jgi:hypothetical protein